jgi:hypothetical protein
MAQFLFLAACFARNVGSVVDWTALHPWIRQPSAINLLQSMSGVQSVASNPARGVGTALSRTDPLEQTLLQEAVPSFSVARLKGRTCHRTDCVSASHLKIRAVQTPFCEHKRRLELKVYCEVIKWAQTAEPFPFACSVAAEAMYCRNKALFCSIANFLCAACLV